MSIFVSLSQLFDSKYFQMFAFLILFFLKNVLQNDLYILVLLFVKHKKLKRQP